jgi:hypothetical protein
MSSGGAPERNLVTIGEAAAIDRMNTALYLKLGLSPFAGRPGGVYSHRTVGGEERITPPRGSTA